MMSSIPYSFHWVRKSLDEKKQQHHGESRETISTIKHPSWFKQFLSIKTNNNNQSNESSRFDFEFLHSIL